MLALLFIFLAVAAAYYFLGTPLLDFIHRFVREFTHSFPLWTFFLPFPILRRDGGEPAKPAQRTRAAMSGGARRF
jgi:hypothetical protein